MGLIWIKREVFLSSSVPSVDEILAKTRLLGNLSSEWRSRLAHEARTVSFARGRSIFLQDEPCPGLYCVAQGLVKLFKVAPSGKELVLHFAEPGGTFAEVAAIGGFVTPANAEAVQDTLCALVPAERLQLLLINHHALCLELLTGMSFWVRQLVGTLEDIVLRDASGRVARHLLEADPSGGRDAFQLAIFKRDLASHLAMTSETLSRTLRRLAEAGLIELGEGQRLRLLDRTRLEALAQGSSGHDRG